MFPSSGKCELPYACFWLVCIFLFFRFSRFARLFFPCYVVFFNGKIEKKKNNKSSKGVFRRTRKILLFFAYWRNYFWNVRHFWNEYNGHSIFIWPKYGIDIKYLNNVDFSFSNISIGSWRYKHFYSLLTNARKCFVCVNCVRLTLHSSFCVFFILMRIKDVDGWALLCIFFFSLLILGTRLVVRYYKEIPNSYIFWAQAIVDSFLVPSFSISRYWISSVINERIVQWFFIICFLIEFFFCLLLI